jgi:hypothetical protein
MLPLDWMLAVLNDPDADDHRRDRMAELAAVFCHPKLQHVAINQAKSASDLYIVEQINIVSVPSGKHLTAEEATQPVVRLLDDPVVENNHVVDVVPEVLT